MMSASNAVHRQTGWAREHLPACEQVICQCLDPRQWPNSGWLPMAPQDPGQGKNRCLSHIPEPVNRRPVCVAALRAGC